MIVALACAGSASRARAQHAEPPVVVGTLAGAGVSAVSGPRDVQLYGTDLGWTFIHDNELFVLFGDTWRDQKSVCSIADGGWPSNDDAEARLPIDWDPSSGMPPVTFLSTPGATPAFQAIQVLRNGVSLNMGLNRTPLTGFSDGERAIGAFQTASFVRCTPNAAGEPSCAAPLTCRPKLGQCVPTAFGIPQLCDADSNLGCVNGQFCLADGVGFCSDDTSSQPDPANRVPLEIELSVPRADAPTKWESQLTFQTNKFMNMTARGVRSLGSADAPADYRPGTSTVLIWGRPGFYAGPGFDTGVYLMAHDLPLAPDAMGKLSFQPRYFSGLDEHARPRWSASQTDAVPLALDGVVNGDPRETVSTINQMAISWLPAPIEKWVMLYGGGAGQLPFMTQPDNGSVPTGAIAIRFADQPWGPWTPPQTYWDAGAPDRIGSPLGPDGVLFDPLCIDQAQHQCTRSDPTRPAHVFNKYCAAPMFELDSGFLYAPNIIDAYTRANERGGLDVYWNVSTWNPYRVVLVRTSFAAGP